MKKFRLLVGLLAVSAVPLTGCDKVSELLKGKSSEQANDSDEEEDDDDSSSDKPKKKKKNKKAKVLADIGFRPERDGWAFQNQGGEYPRTTGILNEKVMVRMFGEKACVDGDAEDCTLTLPAAEFADRVNRAMNNGRCEGMAVAALTFWKGIDKPESMWSLTNHTLDKKEATPFIAQYWAYQMMDPVRSERMAAARRSTPSSVVDQLVTSFKANEFSTLAFWHQRGRGGHAVTPYAVEDQGNGIQHIKVYDNNYPDKESIIVIDRNADTWRYDTAALNPGRPADPWYGDASTRTLVVVPLDLRLKAQTCPFCTGSATERIIWPRAASATITDQEGRRLGYGEDGKLINEIPNAQVVLPAAYLEGGAPAEPIFFLPEDNDYDVVLSKAEGTTGNEEDAGVAVFSGGSAVTVEGAKLGGGQKDTLSVGRDGSGLRYRAGGGKVPALKVAIDDNKEGVAVRVANLESDGDSDVELSVDRKTRKAVVQGGGKSSKSYDLEMSHVAKGQRGVEKVEQKDVKFKLGESHAIDAKRPVTRPKPGTKATPPRITRGAAPKRVVKKPEDAKKPEEKKPDGKTPDVKKPDGKRTPITPPKTEPPKVEPPKRPVTRK